MQILHPEDAKILGCPEGVEDCQGLPVVITGDKRMVSFWQPNAYEIEALQRGGSIFLSVIGPHPLVSIGVDEYSAATATETDDEALERAASSSRFSVSPFSSDADAEAFKAGARWQKARPVNLTLKPLTWENPAPNVHAAISAATRTTYIISEHDGKVYYGPDPVAEWLFDGTIDQLKEKLQARRDAAIMELIDLGVAI